jgi:hypothetical protein
VAILEFTWFALTSPWALMPILWPLFLVPAVMALVFALTIRVWAFRAVGKDRVHPVMHSTLGWPLLAVAWIVGFTWLCIALTVGVLTLAAMTRTPPS